MSDKKQIRDWANEAIKALYKKNGKVDEKKLKNFSADAMNWRSLGCWSVEEKFVIYIDRASPNAINFQDYIKNYIEERVPSSMPIEVKTEW